MFGMVTAHATTRQASLTELEPAGVSRLDVASTASRGDQGPADPASAFVYRKGRFTPLPKLAGVQQHSGINNRRQVTGIYFDPKALPGPGESEQPNTVKGFVQDRRGRVTALALPYPYLHAVRGINDRGQIVGYYDNDAARTDGGGFLLGPKGKLTPIDVPGALATSPWGINDHGAVVGNYTRPDLTFGGFLRTRDGEITRIDVPEASFTTPNDINDRGQVVGAYLDADAAPNPDGTVPPNAVHGFLWDDGRIKRFDAPGAILTQPFGINNRGQISGGYSDAGANQHGFLRSRAEYTTLDVPGRSNTVAIDINDRGQVVIPDPNTSLIPVSSP